MLLEAMAPPIPLAYLPPMPRLAALRLIGAAVRYPKKVE